MRNSCDVKDKSITLENFQFRAHVAYYDGRVVDCGLHATLPAAQRVLLKYPRDVWDGYEISEIINKELDRNVRKTFKPTKTTRRKQGPLFYPGRTLAGPIRIRDGKSEGQD